MDRYLKVLLGVFSVLGIPAQGMALELFGVELESASRDQLREAVKQAGLVLIREGGDEEWFDVYDSSAVMAGSSRLYLGFVKQDQRFAFAEYEFNGLDPGPVLRNLTRKYGAADTRKGRFASDTSYRWQLDGVQIRLRSDWQNYKTRLSYVIPANLASLRAERAANRSEPEKPSISVY